MSLNLVSEHLLAANGLSHQDLFSILGQLTERRLDYGDLYFQSSYHESWVLEDSIIKDGSYNIDQASASVPSAARKPVLPMPIRLASPHLSRAHRPRVTLCVIPAMVA